MAKSNRFDERLEQALTDENLGELFHAYRVTKTKLVDNIYQEIKGAEPNLSDHGPEHIHNVLENAHFLLGSDGSLTPIELYCLGMIILFHDVGNLFGREQHHKKIGKIFDWARGNDAELRREKVLVVRAAKAHTGTAADGTLDTLKEIDEEDHLMGKKVRLQQLAAILRFSDELAEGPQRTSEFLRRNAMFQPDAQLFHDYASITHIFIDRGTERIRLTYEVDLSPSGEEDFESLAAWLHRILNFTYIRAAKLDQERRYARFYSDLLGPFKATMIQYNFHWKEEIMPVDLSPISLDDKVIPGQEIRLIPDLDNTYKTDQLVSILVSQAKELNKDD